MVSKVDQQSHPILRFSSLRVCATQATGIEAQGVKEVTGEGGLPKVVLNTENGSSAEIYLFGGCLTSWKVGDGNDLLFVRPDAVFTGLKPISGGIPHCFPQFGPGPIQQHGFARNVPWAFVNAGNEGGSPSVTLELKDNEYSRAMWNHTFVLTYKIVLEPQKLSTALTVRNLGTKEFSFTTGLHSYFRASISGAVVKGLKGCDTLNKDPDPKNPVAGIENREEVTFPGFVDCMYLNAPSELVLSNGLGNVITIKSTGWKDAVLWNPYLTMEDSYKNFVCVENAQLEPVVLQPGESWTAEQELVPAEQ